MEYPGDLRYTKEHEWLRYDEASNTAVIGITEFAQRELGDVVFVELQPAGTVREKDSVFGTVEAVKTVSELFMPVSGTIVEVNSDLDGQPELVNQDPYGGGWMVKIEVASMSEVDELLDAAAYSEMTA